MWFPVLLLLVATARGDKLVSPVSPPDAALAGGHEGDLAPPHEDLTPAASSTSNKDAVILSYESSPNEGDGQYSFKFETSDGVNRAEEGELKEDVPEGPGVVAKGSYSYVGDDGVTYTVTYVADENGFQPLGDHLPTPHPDIVAALAQNKVEEESAAAAASPEVTPAYFYKNSPYHYTRSHYASPEGVAPISKELVAPDRPAAPVVVPVLDSTIFLKSNPQVFTKSHYEPPAPLVSQDVAALQNAVPVESAKPSAIFFKTNPSFYNQFHFATPAPIADPAHRSAVDSARPSAIFVKTSNPSYYTGEQHAAPTAAPIAQAGYFKHYPAYDHNREYYYKHSLIPKYKNQEFHHLYHGHKNKYSYAFGTRYGS